MTVLETPRRRDVLPEDRVYQDLGCEVSATCLACPLERCRYDVPIALQRTAATRAAVLERRALGESIDAVAVALGISRRTVLRHSAAGRAS